jgi:hypothetical protein
VGPVSPWTDIIVWGRPREVSGVRAVRRDDQEMIGRGLLYFPPKTTSPALRIPALRFASHRTSRVRANCDSLVESIRIRAPATLPGTRCLAPAPAAGQDQDGHADQRRGRQAREQRMPTHRVADGGLKAEREIGRADRAVQPARGIRALEDNEGAAEADEHDARDHGRHVPA